MRLAFSFLFSLIAFAQSGGTISGTITNPDGQPVAAAPMQFKHVETGRLFNTSSSRNGSYTLSALPAGTYELLIPDIGFTYAKYERKSIALRASQTLRLDLRLEWGINLGTPGDDPTTILRGSRRLAPPGRAPRMPDGRPDLSRVWVGQNDPNPAQPAALPWADAIVKERIANHVRDHPSAFCLPNNILLVGPEVYKIIQTPKLVMILPEGINAGFRQVFLDGGGHPKDPDPTWMGHSIGRWEQDTLVVDTVGFNDKSWLGVHPHTEMLHTVTRYRRPDLGHLEVEVTVEDPGAFTKPWKTHNVWELAPGEEIQEYICVENNKDVQHLQAK